MHRESATGGPGSPRETNRGHRGKGRSLWSISSIPVLAPAPGGRPSCSWRRRRNVLAGGRPHFEFGSRYRFATTWTPARFSFYRAVLLRAGVPRAAPRPTRKCTRPRTSSGGANQAGVVGHATGSVFRSVFYGDENRAMAERARGGFLSDRRRRAPSAAPPTLANSAQPGAAMVCIVHQRADRTRRRLWWNEPHESACSGRTWRGLRTTSPDFSRGSRPASRPGVRSARSGPKSVSGNTVEARDVARDARGAHDAGGRLGATRRATLSGRQRASRRLPDAPHRAARRSYSVGRTAPRRP